MHGFLPDTDPLKAQRYRIKDYLAEIRFANVPKAIHVQAAVNTPDPVAETEWLQGFADETGYPQGIVAECHLARPDAAEVLDRHLTIRQRPRHPQFRRGPLSRRSPPGGAVLRSSRPRSLVSCIDTRVELADDLLDLARAFPATAICVDHCAIPMARDHESFRAWRAAMEEMAKARQRDDEDFGPRHGRSRAGPSRSIRPYVLGSIEAFGVDRVVFGTNWPVDRMFSSYPDVDQRLCRDHRVVHARGADQRCSPATPNASFGSEGGAAWLRRSASDLAVTGVHHIGDHAWRASKTRSRSGRRSSASRRAGRPCSKALISAASSAIPNASIKAAFVDLPGGGVIELLDYHQVAERAANPEATANPGNVHLCLAVDDAASVWQHAVACGARPVSPDGPVDIEAGPNKGARVLLFAHPRRRHAGTVPAAAPGGDAMIKRVSFLRRKEGMSREEFFAHWTGPHAEIVKQTAGYSRPALRQACRAGRRRRPPGTASANCGSKASRRRSRLSPREPCRSMLAEDRPKFTREIQACFVEEQTAMPPPHGR